MGLSERRKGAGFENEIANDLSDCWGRHIKRELGQARDSGCDIKVPPFYIECKRRHRIAVYEWLKQAVDAALDIPGIRYPVVVARADREDAIVIMRYSDWKELAAGELGQ